MVILKGPEKSSLKVDKLVKEVKIQNSYKSLHFGKRGIIKRQLIPATKERLDSEPEEGTSIFYGLAS